MEYQGDSEFVELGECDSEQEFLVVRALLESEGIECLSPRLWNTALIDKRGYEPFTIGVRQGDLARARKILDTYVEAQPDATAPPES
ncbi:MAG TPA: hypothetical protein VMU24_09745 [Candidatus Acidoferrales bacterium]|nr:hypothetical protein [Candidatus Acidoferrales bacterium]